MEIIVTHVSGSTHAGRVQQFDTDRLRLGRRPDNDIAFDPNEDRAVSGHHAQLTVENGQLYVRDLGSQNGTWVNGMRITAPVALGPDDLVRLGEAGPELRVAAGTDAQPLPERKAGVGQATMQRAIDAKTGRERSRTTWRLGLLAAAVVVAAAVGIRIYLQERGEIEEDIESNRAAIAELRDDIDEKISRVVADHDKELAALGGRLGANERKVAQLSVKLEERSRALGALATRADIADRTRAAMMRELIASSKALNAELRKTEHALRAEIASAQERWDDVVARHAKAIFMIVSIRAQGRGIGTAFAIRPDGLLATNGHVEHPLNGADVQKKFAVQNTTGKVFPITAHRPHPKYVNAAFFQTPDVALIKIDTRGERLPHFELATESELRQLRPGVHVGTLGYPGEFSSTYLSKQAGNRYSLAAATFVDGWVSRVTGYRIRGGTPFRDAHKIQHSLSTSGGCSGSPIFTADGRVVAVHHAGLPKKTFVTDIRVENGKLVTSKGTVKPGGLLNWGIRVDELRDFWNQSGW